MQLSMLEQMENFPSCGKTSLVSCPTKETPLDVSWQGLSGEVIPYCRQTGKDGPVQAWCPGQGHGSLGGFSMLNISEFPNAAAVSLSSSILEKKPIQLRFYLNPKQAAFILRRCVKREKNLSERLQRGLAWLSAQTMRETDI